MIFMELISFLFLVFIITLAIINENKPIYQYSLVFLFIFMLMLI